MEKENADRLILTYRDRIFGFALAKLRSIEQANELASDIVCEVYTSFLHTDDIANTDGYVYRIARNVYARYINRMTQSRRLECSDDILLSFEDKNPRDPAADAEYAETIARLRQEIGFLTVRQRRIIYLHYYMHRSVAEIARQLQISEGTVKWHLSDARSSLKEGMEMENKTMTGTQKDRRQKKQEKYPDDLAVNPIRFISMGHNGTPGGKGDTADMFDTVLKQNIAYACYHKALSAEEIARRLNVPLIYIEDELKVLCEYGYLDRTDKSKNPKYLTNMYITDMRVYDQGVQDSYYKEAARFLCDNYYAKVFEDFDHAADHWGLVCADNDTNYMKYTLVMLCSRFAYVNPQTEDTDRFMVKRPDGGCFIAHAAVTDENAVFTGGYDPYWCCGYMTRCSEQEEAEDCYQGMSVDCRFSRRDGGWRDNLTSDWESLYRFIKGGCKPDVLTIEEYKRLCDKGYLADDKVQVLLYAGGHTFHDIQDIILKNAAADSRILQYGAEFDKRIFAQTEKYFPEHIRPLAKAYCDNSMAAGRMIPCLIERMLKDGMLQPLADAQKKSVFSLLSYSV